MRVGQQMHSSRMKEPFNIASADVLFEPFLSLPIVTAVAYLGKPLLYRLLQLLSLALTCVSIPSSLLPRTFVLVKPVCGGSGMQGQAFYTIVPCSCQQLQVSLTSNSKSNTACLYVADQ